MCKKIFKSVFSSVKSNIFVQLNELNTVGWAQTNLFKGLFYFSFVLKGFSYFYKSLTIFSLLISHSAYMSVHKSDISTKLASTRALENI